MTYGSHVSPVQHIGEIVAVYLVLAVLQHFKVVCDLCSHGVLALAQVVPIPQMVFSPWKRPVLLLQVSSLVCVPEAAPDPAAEVSRQLRLVYRLELAERHRPYRMVYAPGWVARWVVLLCEGSLEIGVGDVVGYEFRFARPETEASVADANIRNARKPDTNDDTNGSLGP